MELTNGTEVDGWVVEGVLGRGAMATVYAVRHRALGTRAALKVLGRVDAILEQRLVAEGRAQGAIEHPGVVGVLDHVRVDNHPALVLELVEGGDLATILAQGSLRPDESLDVFRQITEALDVAHERGLVHRDLKPSNVLMRCDDAGRWIAKVGDFGLVKTLDGDLTASHGVVGTPRYMAPEQMRASGRVDRRADIFSLGCLLFELVTGQPAFSGDDWVDLYAAKNASRYPDATAWVADLPDVVALAIRGCLHGSPESRIPSCDVLLAVLAGQPWAPPASDPTLDTPGALTLCPACGAPDPTGDGVTCGACDASTTLAERFRLVELLSESSTTRVFRALDLRRGSWVVARALSANADAVTRERMDRGVRLSLELDHPQLAVGLCAPFDEHGALWEVRRWVPGRSLADELATHRYSEADVLEIMASLCGPLRYLAKRSPPVVHGAATPGNIIRGTDGALVLTDLGQLRDQVADGSLHDDPEGAPELWVGDATPASDVFGLGTLAVTLLMRAPPGTLGHRDPLEGLAMRPELQELLVQMRAEVPSDRPTVDEVEHRVAALIKTPQHQVRSFFRRRPLWTAPLLGVAFLVAAGSLAVMTGSVWLQLRRLQDIAPGPRAPTAHAKMPLPSDPPLPFQVREVGADLASVAPPGTDCGPPFQASLTVSGGVADGARTIVEVTCDGTAHDLGEVARDVRGGPASRAPVR